jgi:RNA polymerase sigma-70 factor (ECF subfamily)
MVALAASMTGSREVGAELAQEALLRAFRDWPRVSGLERPGAWVRRATVNLAVDAYRRRSTEQATLARMPSSASPPDGFGVDDPFWVLARSLPDRQCAVVALRYVDDLPLEEIAQVLEVSVGTVKSTLFDARRTLARALGAEEVSE